VLSLCLAGKMDVANERAKDAPSGDRDTDHFWHWLRGTFNVGAVL
jgi:hypothetical protein